MPDFVDTEHRLIAILRGITPQETETVVATLLEIGYRAIEIPLNSPDPFQSIEIAVKTADTFTGEPCLIGAGTVLDTDQVRSVSSAGGNIVVSPNMDRSVITETKRLNMASFPGVFTATEAFAAIDAGATGLKFFPASVLGPDGIKALGAVLPNAIAKYAVGGVNEANMASYSNAGIVGFGIGSNLYKLGKPLNSISADASKIIKSYHTIIGRS